MRLSKWTTGRGGVGLLRPACVFALLLAIAIGPPIGEDVAPASAAGDQILADDLVIEISAAVVVSETPFALADVATVAGPAEQAEMARRVEIGVPGDGLLRREAVLEALVAGGVGGVRLRLVMPAAVRVTLDETLAAAVRRLAGWRWRVEVEPLGPVPAGRLVFPPSIPPGAGSATLRFADDSGNERALAVRLSWSKPAVVALRPLERGVVIAPTDVEVREVRVTRSLQLATEAGEVVGRRLVRNLLAGEPVPLNYLSATPIIQRGDSVIITVRRSGLVVEVKGEALDPGAEGDRIRVRNLRSKTVLQAVIIGPGRVEVP